MCRGCFSSDISIPYIHQPLYCGVFFKYRITILWYSLHLRNDKTWRSLIKKQWMNMSNNPQWKSFQPPPDTLDQEPIIDFKTMSSNGKSSALWLLEWTLILFFISGKRSSTSFNFNRSGSNASFSQEFPILGTEKASSSQMSYSNGLYSSSSTTQASARNFPSIGTFSMDSNNVFNR